MRKHLITWCIVQTSLELMNPLFRPSACRNYRLSFVLPCGPDYHETHREPPASALQMFRLKVSTTMPDERKYKWKMLPYPCPHSETILTSVSKNTQTLLEHSNLGLGVVACASNLRAGGSLWVSGQRGLQLVLGQPRLHSQLQSSRKQRNEGRGEGKEAGRGKGRIVAWSYVVFCRSPLLSSNFKISRDFSR